MKQPSDLSDKEDLFRRFEPLAASMAQRMMKRSSELESVVDVDDVKQHAKISLLKAIEVFDPEKSPNVEQFLTWKIKCGVIDFFRSNGYWLRERDLREERSFKRRESYHTQSLDAPMSEEEGSSFTLADLIPAEEESRADPIQKELLREALGRLSSGERKVLAGLYNNGLNQAEIAEEMGVSQPRVSHIHDKALHTLEILMKNPEMIKAGDNSLGRKKPGVERVLSEDAPISRRQHQVLLGAAKGQSAAETAEELGLSEHTARSYRKTLMRDLGVNNIVQAVAIGCFTGLIDPEDLQLEPVAA